MMRPPAAGRPSPRFRSPGGPARGMLSGMADVTQVLAAIEQGDPHAAGQLLPLVYDELRRLAAQKLAREKAGQTLQATALVHEAYLRLVAKPEGESGGANPHWDSRGHFFAAAAEAMRRILVEAARRKARGKHGGGHTSTSTPWAPPTPPGNSWPCTTPLSGSRPTTRSRRSSSSCDSSAG